MVVVLALVAAACGSAGSVLPPGSPTSGVGASAGPAQASAPLTGLGSAGAYTFAPIPSVSPDPEGNYPPVMPPIGAIWSGALVSDTSGNVVGVAGLGDTAEVGSQSLVARIPAGTGPSLTVTVLRADGSVLDRQTLDTAKSDGTPGLFGIWLTLRDAGTYVFLVTGGDGPVLAAGRLTVTSEPLPLPAVDVPMVFSGGDGHYVTKQFMLLTGTYPFQWKAQAGSQGCTFAVSIEEAWDTAVMSGGPYGATVAAGATHTGDEVVTLDYRSGGLHTITIDAKGCQLWSVSVGPMK